MTNTTIARGTTKTTVAITPTQQAVLAAACARPDRLLLPLPSGLGLKGGAAQKVIAALSRRGLVEEAEVEGGATASWRARDTALAMLGIELAPKTLDEVQPEGARPIRPGTKQASLIAMLERDEGASLAEIMAATGWQGHTVRGAIAGALKKRLGLTITPEREESRGRVWKIVT